MLSLTLCACDSTEILPWGEKTNINNVGLPNSYTVYVCGAVQNEGYYRLYEGETYFVAIREAGLLVASAISSNAFAIVTEQPLPIFVDYIENGTVKNCINVNSQYFLLGLPIDGISLQVVNKIADYIENCGVIRNKKTLLAVLGDDDYENYHYKLYVAEADYEEAH